MSHRFRICVFGERIAPPADEGIKNVTLSLAAAFRALGCDTLALTTASPGWPEREVFAVEADRLLRSSQLAARLAAFKPDAVVYVPTASLTVASGLRSRTLARYAGAPVALVATQGRRHSLFAQMAARAAAPTLCVTFASATTAQARRLGWRARQLTPGVDLAAFRPALPGEKLALRAQFGLPANAFVVLHAGHLNRGRGVLALAALADLAQPVLAASASTVHEDGLVAELRQAGVLVITEFVPAIADLYRACDAYIFPVPPNPLAPGSIDVPLSVLEAAACGLPIVTTRFGALPELWPDATGVIYYEGQEELCAAVARLRAENSVATTRRLAEPFGWAAVSRRLLESLTEQEKSL